MKQNGVLVVVSGFSGAGKGTLMKALIENYDNYALSISATTRSPRAGEIDRREYFFKTREEFEQMIADNQMIEYAQYVGNYYGTPREYVCSNIDAGRDVILEIEIQGALKIKESFPEAVLIFITPPSAAELKRRLVRRGTEPLETIRARLIRASEEAEGIENYDYILVNDKVGTCAKEMHYLIQSMHFRVQNHLPFIEEIREEMKAIGKEHK